MVELYGVRCRIGGMWYEHTVCAESWEDAEVLAEKLGGEVTGKILEEFHVDDEEMSRLMRPEGIWSFAKTHSDV